MLWCEFFFKIMCGFLYGLAVPCECRKRGELGRTLNQGHARMSS